MPICNHEWELNDVIPKPEDEYDYIYFCKNCVATKHEVMKYIDSWINDDPNDNEE